MSAKPPKRVHVGCGSVYLEGYINVDVNIPGESFLASERPDLVAVNQTTPDRYYKYPVTRIDIENGKLQKKPIVVDVFADAKNLPFPPNFLDEIRCVQVFEHFTYNEGERILEHWYQLLKPHGTIHLDIPDLDATMRGYLGSKSKTQKRWYLRLLFGSQKNEYSLHKAMYSKRMLSALLRNHGFSRIRELGNIHFYPAFAMEARKR